MKPIYLQPNQSVLFVPMKEEPMWEEAPMLCDDGIWRGRYRYGNGDAWDVTVDEFEPPFRPGEICYVRETWFCPEYEEYGIKNRDLVYYKLIDDPDEWPWASPVTMPEWASRRHVRIVSCEPIQQDGKWKWRVEVKEVKA